MRNLNRVRKDRIKISCSLLNLKLKSNSEENSPKFDDRTQIKTKLIEAVISNEIMWRNIH